jgi:hypothetical protein
VRQRDEQGRTGTSDINRFDVVLMCLCMCFSQCSSVCSVCCVWSVCICAHSVGGQKESGKTEIEMSKNRIFSNINRFDAVLECFVCVSVSVRGACVGALCGVYAHTLRVLGTEGIRQNG